VSIWDVPWVAEHEKLAVKDLGHNMYLVKAIYGFKEILDIGEVLTLLAKQFHIVCPLMETSFFMARDSLVAKKIPQMSLWRELLFIWMMQNASRAADFFKIDPGRLIELGAKIEL
jgi:KUP system potassium uptake protein